MEKKETRLVLYNNKNLRWDYVQFFSLSGGLTSPLNDTPNIASIKFIFIFLTYAK